jgi:hypothetical protein
MNAIASAVDAHRTGKLKLVPGKIDIATKNEVVSNEYDLAPAVYLSGYHLPKDMQVERLGDLFDVEKGNVPAADDSAGDYPFFTTSSEFKRHKTFGWDSEAIVIPTVSSTGHGHASIKNVHYVKGKFAAATITAVLTPKKARLSEIFVPYIYYYLLTHKDEVIVPQMRGAANVSLSLERIRHIKIPLPGAKEAQRQAVADLIAKRDELEQVNRRLSVLEVDWRDELRKFAALV